MLCVERIRKLYQNGRGISSLSLEIAGGETVCFVGPNGSGKSTSLNVIAGIVRPDGGTCTINGQSTYGIEAKRQIGFLEESPHYYPNSTIADYLNFIWSVKYPNSSNDEVFRLLEAFGLAETMKNKMKVLSMGMRKRVGIISAIMNYPPLIILDEPTNGIDTKSLLVLKDELALAKGKGCHIIISGHVLDFIKSVADRVVFIRDGCAVKAIANSSETNLDELYRALYLG